MALNASALSRSQAERIENVEDELIALSKAFLNLQTEYNYHLEDLHKVKPDESSKYTAAFMTDKVYDRAKSGASAKRKIKELEKWESNLLTCFKAILKPYNEHLKYFHEVQPILLDVQYVEPSDTLSKEERIQGIESNAVRLSNFMPRLQEAYNSHVKMLHY